MAILKKLPITSSFADVVVSNCVMNLVPDKTKAFTETFRVLKPGGHFSISDIVLVGNLPEGLQKNAEMYAGCISGAIQKSEYLAIIEKAGFVNLNIQKEKRIVIPTEILTEYLNEDEMKLLVQGELGIFSITAYAEKPLELESEKTNSHLAQKATSCGPDSDCC